MCFFQSGLCCYRADTLNPTTSSERQYLCSETGYGYKWGTIVKQKEHVLQRYAIFCNTPWLSPFLSDLKHRNLLITVEKTNVLHALIKYFGSFTMLIYFNVQFQWQASPLRQRKTEEPNWPITNWDTKHDVTKIVASPTKRIPFVGTAISHLDFVNFPCASTKPGTAKCLEYFGTHIFGVIW